MVEFYKLLEADYLLETKTAQLKIHKLQVSTKSLKPRDDEKIWAITNLVVNSSSKLNVDYSHAYTLKTMHALAR